ncbi:MAG: hypothetical protein J7L39_03130 [Candidatus Aenigmarchaeota archaeon]|nr:hypothetical protein [Candidatus Aenigmarchaeota archaeon]
MIETLLLIVLIFAAVYLFLKIVKNLILLGVIILVILLVLSFPNFPLFKSISSLGMKTLEKIGIFENKGLEIIDVFFDEDGFLNVKVRNNLGEEISNITFYVDRNLVSALEGSSIKPNSEEIFKLDWKSNFTSLMLKAGSIEVLYEGEK